MKACHAPCPHWEPKRGKSRDIVSGDLAAVENPIASGHRETVATCSTNPAPHIITQSNNHGSPIMIEIPPARIPEEPGAVIPHAGICEGGTG